MNYSGIEDLSDDNVLFIFLFIHTYGGKVPIIVA